MRTILLLTFLMFGYVLPTYSQCDSRLENKRFKINKAFNDLSLTKSIEIFNPMDSLGPKWWSNTSMKGKILVQPYPKDKEEKLVKKPNGITTVPLTSYDMPIAEPRGFFQMPIDKPDSTANYTLLIKDF